MRALVALFALCSVPVSSEVAPIDPRVMLAPGGISYDAFKVSPNSYSPYYSVCEARLFVRYANYSISESEKEYVSVRDHYARKDFLGLMARLDFPNVEGIMPSGVIKIGLAISGGGYRSMLSGAGVLSAYDLRTPGTEFHLGGIYQSASYIAGNSGGLWLVANNLLNDGVPIHRAIRSQTFEGPLIEGCDDLPIAQLKDQMDHRRESGESPDDQPLTLRSGKFVAAILQALFTKDSGEPQRAAAAMAHKVLNFYRDLNIEVRVKKMNGFQVSLTDYWGRAVSKKVFPEGKRLINLTLSSVTSLASFQNFSQPFPIFGSVERLPGTQEGSHDSHIFEFNPFEFGSWDSYLNSFVEMKFLGTSLSGGHPTMKTKDGKYSLCVLGYDNLALVIGTSSSLFNTFFHYVYRAIVKAEESSSSFLSLILTIFGLLGDKNSDTISHPEYAVFSPNPFYKTEPVRPEGRSVENQKSLFIVDGGDDGQNIPFAPLLVRSRAVEVIFAFDASADENNFPNGTSLYRTAQRYQSTNSSLRLPLFYDGDTPRSIFPSVPDPQTFLDRGQVRRPVFFGCDLADFPQMAVLYGSLGEKDKTLEKYDIWTDYLPPVVVYNANYHHTYPSNSSTFQTTYTDAEVRGMVMNGYSVAAYPQDGTYRRCVGCALMKRRVDRLGRGNELPDFCTQCFDEYCYKASQSHVRASFS